MISTKLPYGGPLYNMSFSDHVLTIGFKKNGKFYCKKALSLYCDYMEANKDMEKSVIQKCVDKCINAMTTPEPQFIFSD